MNWNREKKKKYWKRKKEIYTEEERQSINERIEKIRVRNFSDVTEIFLLRFFRKCPRYTAFTVKVAACDCF